MFKKKALVFITLLAVLFALLTSNGFASLETELEADKAKNTLIPNGDFADENLSSNFRGAFALKPGEGINGSNAVEVEQGSAVYFVFTELEPNTPYTFVAYFKTLVMEGGDPPCIVIKGQGGDEIYAPGSKTEDYIRAEHSFMTGDEVRAEAEFHVWNVTAGPIMVDSIYLFLYEIPAQTAEPETTAATATEKLSDTDNILADQESDTSEPGDNTILIVIAIIAVVIIVAVIIIVVVTRKRKK